MAKRERKTGRPKLPPEQVRGIRFEIRLSQVECERLTKAAKGEKLSTWIRAAALRAAEAGG